LPYTLDTHEDVPSDVREQLYAEEEHNKKRRKKRSALASGSFPPINIAKVLLTPPSTYSADTPASTTAARMGQHQKPASLALPVPRDRHVRRYADWQCNQVEDEALKQEFGNAHDITLSEGLDLEQLHEDEDPGFFIDRGVKLRIAQRFVRDIEALAEEFIS
jgi:hypothetical protein